MSCRDFKFQISEKNLNFRFQISNYLKFQISNFRFWVPAIAFFAATPAFATPVELDEIEVTAPELAPTKDTAATSKIVAPREEEIKSTTQIVERSPGVHVKRYNSTEDSATISIRGSPSNQINIYYDNVPLNSAAGNAFSMAVAPPQNLSSMEIYRGGAPGKASEGSPAGAIFLNTLKRPEKFRLKFSNMYGSFNTYTGYLQAAAPIKKSWLMAAFEHSQSSGDFTYIDDNGTRLNTNDDTLQKRQNNAFMSENFLAKAGYDGDSLHMEASNTLLVKRQGVPGLGSFQSLNAKLNSERNITAINADYKSNHVTVFFDYLNSRFADPDGEIGLSAQDNSDYTYRIGGNFSRAIELGKFNTLFILASYCGEMYKPKNYLSSPVSGRTSVRDQLGLVAEDTVKLFSERLIVVPTLRFTAILNDISGDDPSMPVNYSNTVNNYQLTGKLGAKFRIVPDFYAKGNFYRGYRNPTFSELFGDRGSVVGNPELKAEKGTNFDLGLVYETGKFRTEAAYFLNKSNDLIQFLQTSQFAAKPQNLSSSLVQGAEFSAQAEYLRHFSHSLSYTFQNAKDTSGLATGGKTLPGRPRHELWLETSVFNGWGKLTGEYNFMSGNFLDSQNLLEVTGRNLFNFYASAAPAKWATLNFSVKNITNRHIFDVIGFPLPGRSFWGNLLLKI